MAYFCNYRLLKKLHASRIFLLERQHSISHRFPTTWVNVKKRAWQNLFDMHITIPLLSMYRRLGTLILNRKNRHATNLVASCLAERSATKLTGKPSIRCHFGDKDEGD